MVDKRQHVRTAFSASVKLIHPQIGEACFDTRDMSNGGVFLYTGDQVALPVGTDVRLQAQDMPEDAPIVRATIVRIEGSGIALMFAED